MKRRLILAVAFVFTVAAALFAGANIIHALERQSYTLSESAQVAGTTRDWQVIAPVKPLPRSAPIVVVLAGIAATIPQEEQRDRFIPYANAGEAEIVYPTGIGESWNAIGCCGKAAAENVDDVAFMKALVAALDPGHKHPIFLVGYSNGGRLAYRLACDDPGVFDAMAIVKAMPLPGCVVTRPQSILQIDALDDDAVAYAPGDPGKETPPATVEVGLLRSADECAQAPDVKKYPTMTLSTWDKCASGSRVEFAVYAKGGHNFPPPTAKQPAASSVIMAFFTKTAIKPVPK
jgi:polyhydroxybutyrate depolymerase